jgi:hypothetical protein
VSASGNAIVGAVRAARDNIMVRNYVNVSASDVVTQTTSVSRSSQSSSKQNDERHYG